jgi:hypothetical protein
LATDNPELLGPVRDERGKPEIDQFDGIRGDGVTAGQHQVFELDVAVHDPLLVAELNAGEELSHPFCGLLLGDAVIATDDVVE